MAVLISQKDVLSIGCFDQSQESPKEFGVGGSLDCLVGLEVDSDDENGPGFGFPKKGLVPTSFDVVVLQLSDSMVV